ncbi:hypothetical protein N5C39_10325 [Enterobacter bugandensis]|uniref:Uncharacterized protein n=1 Tax=Enterobacter bugandensis TaxID=881260 RepID=A0AA42PUH1_9ENTR|nr:hypothetical protein [Enterobacter bugandensis]MDH1318757.1 hypothetical protein [Enterobacter bugandensis]
MINISATNAIDQAEKIITDIFENGEHDKNTGESLYRVMTLLSDAREAINSDTENKSDVKPFKKNVSTVIENYVFDALLAVRKLEAIAQTTHESFFKAEDEENQLCSLFSVMWDYANEVGNAIRNIKQEIK